jgi:hypothetical protein
MFADRLTFGLFGDTLACHFRRMHHSHGKSQNSENLGLLDVYAVEKKMRERHGSGGPEPVPLKANGRKPNLNISKQGLGKLTNCHVDC